jgi:hypothetical protein
VARRTLDDQIRAQDSHCGDTDTCLCGSVGGAKAGEYDGGRAAHGAEEGLLYLLASGRELDETRHTA